MVPSHSQAELTVVIVNWNGGDELRDCLQGLRAAVDEGLAKVIVVDNDSRDGSREMAQREFPDYDIFNSGGNLGFGRANNLARPRVTTPYVLILNPDTLANTEALKGMLAFLKSHPEVGAVGCQMRHPDGYIQPLGLQWFPSPWSTFVSMLFLSGATPKALKNFFPIPDPNRSGYVQKLYGGCVMASKQVLDRIGWFDDRYFMYAEDVDLCRTILDQNLKLYYLAEVGLIHEGGGTSKKAASEFPTLMMAESVGQYIRKYQGPLGLLGYRIAVFTGAFLRMIVLSLFKVLKTVMGKKTGDEFSLRKQWLLMLWSLSLRRAAVPKGPTALAPVAKSA